MMMKTVKLGLMMMAIALAGCNDFGQSNLEAPPAVAVVDSTTENDPGLITVDSSDSVTETADRLENAIAEKGLTLFARIDHSANAQKAGEQLPPTQLLIFGNPKVGTPLMNCAATTAIDLPQKLLILEAENKQTQIVYNDPNYLQQRHNITGCDEVLTKVSGVLQSLTETATK